MFRSVATLALCVTLSFGNAAAADADIVLPASSLSVVQFMPLAELSQYPDANAILAVDPQAIYSNATTFTGNAVAQGAATGGITRLVADDLTFTTNPGVGNVTTIRFAVANLNAVTHSVRARVRFYNSDGAALGGGLPNGPGTYVTGYSFNPYSFAPGVTLLSGTLGAGFAVPAGATTTYWAGVTFDNVGTTTGATDADLSNFGQGFFVPVDIGSSTDTIFETTAAGSFLSNNPAGAALNFGGTPVANTGWELVVSGLGSADLVITKTDGVATAIPGGSTTYTIVASNAGSGAVSGATVADTFPASLTCTWTCTGAAGGTCTAAGSGNINDSVNLPNGGSATYTATCAIDAAATGSLANTATITEPTGITDPDGTNNSATDTDTLTPTADLAITKSDGVTLVNPGGSTTYTIVASNAGPSNVSGATVTDTFPAALTCTWTCVGAGGGTCTAAGSGNISDSVNLPAGASTTFTASCSISGAASGSLANTATVAAPAGVTDPAPGNNSATDTDTIALPGNLTISPTSLSFGDVPVGQNSATQTVTLGNDGGTSMQVTALAAASAPFALVGGTCSAVPITIAAAGSCTLDYRFTPAATGAASQSLAVTADSTGSGSISLGGNGVVGVIGVLSATLDFGTVVIGTSGQLVATIINSGTGPLQVTGIPAVAAPFQQVSGGTCSATPFMLAANSSCTVSYSFAPTSAGTFSQPVVISADVGTATVTLTGIGAFGVADVRELPTLGQLAFILLTLLLLVTGMTTLNARRR